MPNFHPRPWHRGSEFGDGPRVPLDRERRARFRFLLNAHHRHGRLTRAARDVGEALVRRLSVDGRCDPAHTTLAGDVGCCDRTVRRATAVMRDLGLLRWQTRLARAGWRAEQTSNAYELMTAEDARARAGLNVVRCGGQTVRETRRIEIQPSLPLPSPAGAQAALAQRRAVVEARLLNSRQPGRPAAT